MFGRAHGNRWEEYRQYHRVQVWEQLAEKAASLTLEQIINQNRWEWTPENMQAAHALAIRQGLYQPVPVEEQNGNWEQGLRESNKRPTPPPIPSGNSADAFRQQENLYEIPLGELRKQVIRQQLGETDGRR